MNPGSALCCQDWRVGGVAGGAVGAHRGRAAVPTGLQGGSGGALPCHAQPLGSDENG